MTWCTFPNTLVVALHNTKQTPQPHDEVKPITFWFFGSELAVPSETLKQRARLVPNTLLMTWSMMIIKRLCYLAVIFLLTNTSLIYLFICFWSDLTSLRSLSSCLILRGKLTAARFVERNMTDVEKKKIWRH